MSKIEHSIISLNEYFYIEPLTLLDVGSRWGIQRPWDQYPENHLQYYGFDADIDECERLNNQNNKKNVKYINAALSDNSCLETLYVTNEPGRSSLFQPNSHLIGQFYDCDGFEITKEISLKTTTLNKVIQSEDIDPDFIKLDVQGAELKIIKGTDASYENIIGFEIEVEFIELYKKQPVFSEVDAYMRSIGFELFDLNRYWATRKSMTLNHSNRGQIIFGDAIYFRSKDSFFSIDQTSADSFRGKLLKYVCALSLYGFFDVAVSILLDNRCPLNEKEVKFIKEEIEKTSRISTLQKICFNNYKSTRMGVLFHCLGRLLSYPNKTSGWGTDYNSIDERYSYYLSPKIARYFGRK